MAIPEGTATKQGLRSRRIAGGFLAGVLVAVGALAGIDVGIPIGREQQGRLDSQKAGESEDWLRELARGIDSPGLPAVPSEGAPAVSLPPVPQLGDLPDTVQNAFKRFDCRANATPSTQCAALAVLQADSRFEPGSAASPVLMAGGANGVYTQGQWLALSVRASSEFDGYLYVDYFESDGTVIHLRPGPYSGYAALTRGAQLRFGDPFKICPPFGADLVVAISTPVRLFDGNRPEVEPAAAYLAALHQVLRRAAGERPDAAPLSGYTAILTSPRDSANL